MQHKKDTLNYGIIGNCKSSALINEDSSIDWCCLPQFDSPSVFGKILDDNIGGQFKIVTDASYSISQEYCKNTCILITKFQSQAHAFHLLDFMPRYQKESTNYYAPPEITRFLRHVKGRPSFKVIYDPKLEYALGITRNYVKDDFIVSIVDDEHYDTLYLYTDLDKNNLLSGSEMILEKDQFMTASYNEKIEIPTIDTIYYELEVTKTYWLHWCYKTPTFKNYNAEVLRSAMTLKLLTFEKSGAVLAAATTSLPEAIGETRNWDYRFCWIRDASMVIKVIAKLGHVKIVENFIRYIIDLIPDKNQKLQIMYGINGEKMLTEKTLSHLEGYKGSKPVRIGNAAFFQKQNDIYGILMDAIHFQIETYKETNYKHEELWSIVKSVVWVVEKNWTKPDKGIWEFRNEDQHFTFSKVLCWVAIDRAIKISNIVQRGEKAKKWESLRSKIRKDIMKNAWSPGKKAFTQTYGTNDLDASVLLMEPYGFIEPNNKKYISTVEAIGKELLRNKLLFRYKNKDDFGEPKSSFTVCTFWYINSLFKTGKVKEAKKLYDELLSYSNHLGLFSEDLDFKTKELLGNFPQAYSHLALIDTALNFNNQSI